MGIILTAMGWTKNISKDDIDVIVDSMRVYKNEDNLDEIGLSNENIVKRIIDINKVIDIYCHSNEDNYMMSLLADITKYCIDRGYINYSDLYQLNEEELFTIMKNNPDIKLRGLLYLFHNIRKEEIPCKVIEGIKVRELKPLVNDKRFVK